HLAHAPWSTRHQEGGQPLWRRPQTPPRPALAKPCGWIEPSREVVSGAPSDGADGAREPTPDEVAPTLARSREEPPHPTTAEPSPRANVTRRARRAERDPVDRQHGGGGPRPIAGHIDKAG